MNEIEKLYKNAGIEPQYKKLIECKHGYAVGKPCNHPPCINCEYSIFEDIMPPFTAEKQLELIKWLATRELKIKTQKQPCATYIGILGQHECFYGIEETHFEQALAGVINCLWQNLTKEEKQEIKRILE